MINSMKYEILKKENEIFIKVDIFHLVSSDKTLNFFFFFVEK